MGWVAFQKERVEGREKHVPWFVGDKTAAYDFAKKHGVQVPHIYRLFDRPVEFRDEDFPDRFVVKPKGLHSTKGVMVLRRLSQGRYFDSMRQMEITESDIRKQQEELYEENRFKGSYKLIVEEKLVGENNEDQIPYDYKLYMFQGENGLTIQYDRNTKPPTGAWFGPNWSELNPLTSLESEWKVLRCGLPTRPRCSDKMLADAAKLSLALPTPFVSVDMYATSRGPVLGELTLAPGGPYYGKQYRFKDHLDNALGAAWERATERLRLRADV
ncbi:ATP-grasp fold amidoligase family protein [Methylobacterium oxalidis]|uniref:ATP-grasp domain-containing protein n=1 Tax=Methylobacterium oxalidis TaxID=944322 RepID=A0A512JBT7_9HYPH|nr:ATP-grasp fold amidoligase family protein [Methylobacterium oxalidis]GEP07371.1 hypothetical protein MOX02_54090 [Methylobacterium oxalidis]GJE33030.1 Phosphoribosylamine--glycine ligase [Methylobacterium oxalidis]GLS64481.1 hypothetical protein GCM10007888_28620 [Methylobacterium oxalidis]